MSKYEYLVAYSIPGGVSRCFVTCERAIDSSDRVESVERSLQAKNGFDSVAIMSFQLLSCREVSDQDEKKGGAA